MTVKKILCFQVLISFFIGIEAKNSFNDTIKVNNTIKYIGNITIDKGEPRVAYVLKREFYKPFSIFADKDVEIIMSNGKKWEAKEIVFNKTKFYVFLEVLLEEEHNRFKLYGLSNRIFVEHDTVFKELQKENHPDHLKPYFPDDKSLIKKYKSVPFTRTGMTYFFKYRNKGSDAYVRRISFGPLMGNNISQFSFKHFQQDVNLDLENWYLGAFVYLPFYPIRNLGVSTKIEYGFNDYLNSNAFITTGVTDNEDDMEIWLEEHKTHVLNLSSEVQYGIRFGSIEPFISFGGRFSLAKSGMVVSQIMDSEDILHINDVPNIFFGPVGTVGVNVYYTQKNFVQINVSQYSMNSILSGASRPAGVIGNTFELKIGF